MVTHERYPSRSCKFGWLHARHTTVLHARFPHTITLRLPSKMAYYVKNIRVLSLGDPVRARRSSSAEQGQVMIAGKFPSDRT